MSTVEVLDEEAQPEKGEKSAHDRPEAALVRVVPTIALTRAEAAASLGMSLSTFHRYVEPDLPRIYVGGGEGPARVVRYRPEDVREWAERKAIGLA